MSARSSDEHLYVLLATFGLISVAAIGVLDPINWFQSGGFFVPGDYSDLRPLTGAALCIGAGLVGYIRRPTLLIGLLPCLAPFILPDGQSFQVGLTLHALTVAAALATFLLLAILQLLTFPRLALIAVFLVVLVCIIPTFLIGHAAALLFVLALLHIGSLSYVQNRTLLASISWREAWEVSWRAVAWWSPLLALAIVTGAFWDSIESYAARAISSSVIASSDWNENLSFLESLRARSDQEFDRRQRGANDLIDQAHTNAQGRADAFPSLALQAFDRTYPATQDVFGDLGRGSCGIKPLCHLRKLGARPIRHAYDHQRKQARANFDREVRSFARDRKGDLAAARDFAKLKAAEAATTGKEKARWAIDTAGGIGRTVSLMLGVAFWYAVVKSLGAMISLFAFNIDSPPSVSRRPICFSDQRKDIGKGLALQFKPQPQYNPNIAPGEIFYVTRSRRYAEFNGRSHFWMPQPFRATAGRLFNCKLFLNKVDYKRPFSLAAVQGRCFVEWRLQEGEVVFFRMRNLVAIESTVTFGTEVSLRIGTLGTGKSVFSTATGPGRLVFVTTSNPSPSGELRFFDTLVAWRNDCKFEMARTQDWTLYTDSPSFRASGAVLAEAQPLGGPNFGRTGMIRFVRAFILPW